MDWNKLFNDFADKYYAVPDFTNEEHVYALQNYLIEKGMLVEDVDFAIKTLLGEAPDKPTNPKIAQQAKKMGLVWKRNGYGPKDKKGITYKVDNDKLVPVDDKKDDDKDDKEKEKEEPKATVTGKDAVADRGKDHNTDVNSDYTDRGMDEPEDDKPKKKDKTLKKVSSEIEEKVFNSDISPDNDEFEEKNKNFVPKGTKIKKDLSNPPPPYKLPKELENLAPKVPKKYIQMIERMVNTQRYDDFKPPISHFIDEKGAGRISAQAGEILTLATVGMSDEQAELFFNSMNEHLDNSDRPSKQIIDKSWVKAAINNRKAIYNRLKKKYPDANLPDDIEHSAWDTETDVNGLGLENYKENKGFSTDIYLKINTPDGPVLDEISLKKDKNVNFLNSGAGKFADWDPDLPDSINQTVYRETQRKVLVDAVGVNLKLQQIMNKDEKLRKAYEETKAGKGSRAKSKLLRNALTELAKSGDKSAEEVLKKLNESRAKFEEESVKAISENPLKENMLKEISTEFPLKAVSEEEESMAIGDMSLDKDTMKEIFGTDNYEDIKENLVAERGPDGKPYVGYKAGVGDEVIPIAEIKIREDGTNYGGQFKFEMVLHKDFAAKLKTANETIYGEE